MDTIRVDGASCICCGRCVKVCPSQIFVQEKAGGSVALSKPGNCIVCGHCVAACPTGAVRMRNSRPGGYIRSTMRPCPHPLRSNC